MLCFLYTFDRNCLPLFIALFESSELLPNDVTCAKETRDLVIECCVGAYPSHVNLP